MIPGEKLSTFLIDGLWLSPDDLDNSYLVDYELGGIGLNDASQGLRVQIWTIRLADEDVIISAPAYPQTVLFSRSGITELSLSFDQNMKPFVAFVQDGDAKFWWWDTNVSQQVFSNLPAGARTPRCCMDDKRETQTNSSDIILAYISDDDELTFRAQRDRYTIDYVLKTDVVGRLIKVGMSNKSRLQFLIQDPLPPGTIC